MCLNDDTVVSEPELEHPHSSCIASVAHSAMTVTVGVLTLPWCSSFTGDSVHVLLQERDKQLTITLWRGILTVTTHWDGINVPPTLSPWRHLATTVAHPI